MVKNEHDKYNICVRVSNIFMFSSKCFQNFVFKDHFDNGLFFIEPFVFKEQNNVIQSVAEAKYLNFLPIWLLLVEDLLLLVVKSLKLKLQ